MSKVAWHLQAGNSATTEARNKRYERQYAREIHLLPSHVEHLPQGCRFTQAALPAITCNTNTEHRFIHIVRA
jgi:hypothetical protein